MSTPTGPDRDSLSGADVLRHHRANRPFLRGLCDVGPRLGWLEIKFLQVDHDVTGGGPPQGATKNPIPMRA